MNYGGQRYDDETGLLAFAARAYDPTLGRFVQPDPLLPDADDPQQLDPYAYARNNPVTMADPTGHAALVASFVGWLATATSLQLLAVAVLGAALTFTNSPFLQSLGMVIGMMAGAAFAGGLAAPGGFLGAESAIKIAGAIALAQSPISPLDPTIKKVIGWAYTLWGGVSEWIHAKNGGWVFGDGKFTWRISRAAAKVTTGSALGTTLVLAAKEVAMVWAAERIALWVSSQGTGVRVGAAFVSGALVSLTRSAAGPLGMIGATYDLFYTLKHPDGRTYDLSGGQGSVVLTFYYHTGFETSSSFGRQHIRVGGDTRGGYWEVGDWKNGRHNFGWGSWITTQKIKVIMNPTQARVFFSILERSAGQQGGYVLFHTDSHTYVSAALQAATGKSAADLHINPGLFHY